MDSPGLTAALADPNPDTALNVMGDGARNNPATLEAIRADPFYFRGLSENWYANALAEGPVFDLPGGSVRFAVGGDFRHETFRQVRTALDVKSERDVSAAFAEIALPIIGAANARPGLHRLELSFAGRYEDYSDFGSTFDPKVGINFLPLPNLKLRGSWGTSFKAPSFYQADPRLTVPQAFVMDIPDPRSASGVLGVSKVLRLFGNNPDL